MVRALIRKDNTTFNKVIEAPKQIASLSTILNDIKSPSRNIDLEKLNLLPKRPIYKEIIIILEEQNREILKSVKLMSKGLKTFYREAQKKPEAEEAGINGIPAGRKQKKEQGRVLSKIDYQLLRAMAKNQPLSKKLITRLQYLEAIGEIKVGEITNKETLTKQVSQLKNVPVLSKYDQKIFNLIKEDPKYFSSIDQYSSIQDITMKKRLDALINHGFILKKEGNLLYQNLDKIKNIEGQKWQDYRTYETYLIKTLSKDGMKNRNIVRKLNDDEVECVKNLKTFGNMSKGQIFELYSNRGAEKFFNLDLESMIKKKLIKEEVKSIKGKEIKLYHLGPSGNEVGNYFVNIRQESKAYSKNDKELLHDLLQYEAYKIGKSKIEMEEGTIKRVLVDRNKRSEIYEKNFREMGEERKQNIADLEIIYEDKQGKEKSLQMEVDRGYHGSVVEKKSIAMPNLIWVTDSKRQANKISVEAKRNGGIYLVN